MLPSKENWNDANAHFMLICSVKKLMWLCLCMCYYTENKCKRDVKENWEICWLWATCKDICDYYFMLFCNERMIILQASFLSYWKVDNVLLNTEFILWIEIFPGGKYHPHFTDKEPYLQRYPLIDKDSKATNTWVGI